jgi:hypothetical protein
MGTTKKAKRPAKTKKTAAKKTATAKKKPAAKTKKPAAKKPIAKAKKPAAKAKKPAAKKPKKKAPVAEVESPGWAAIDAACARVHGDARPLHYAPILPMIAGGDDPLDGISVYRCDRGTPHWHFVTYGFSDLHEKSGDDPETSGFGFELTFRLRRGDEDAPPAWANNVLQNLARYVFRTGNAFGVGHHIPLNGPIALGADTEIHSVAFARDPELGEVKTPYGAVEFLQMVGITRDEAKAIKRWSTSGMLEILAQRDPLMLTSLDRPSLLADPEMARVIEEHTRAEGSSSYASFVTQLEIEPDGENVVVRLGALAVEDLLAHMQGRIAFGRPCSLVGRGTVVSFLPADTAAWSVDGDELTVEATPVLAREVTERVKPERGEYRFDSLPGFTLVVLPTEIKDQEGNVIRVIG